MIKFESFSDERTDTVKFTISITNYGEVVMDFEEWEIEMIKKSNAGLYSPVQVAQVFLMIAQKMERLSENKVTFITDDKVVGKIQGDENGKKKSS